MSISSRTSKVPSRKSAPACSEEHVGRQVIENKLLAALNDDSKVAVLLSGQDLRMLICALEQYSGGPQREFAADMRQLLRAAFH